MKWSISPILDPASSAAQTMTRDYLIVLGVSAFILGVVMAMVGISIWRFREKPTDVQPPPHFGNRLLEITWTVIPCFIVFGLFLLTALTLRQADPDVQQSPDLKVIAHQWWWEIRYPGSGVSTANEIHLPLGTRMLVELDSADVIHDFWVPQLARKMDIIPGLHNRLWLQADRLGTYEGSCGEYCGAEHTWMRFVVIVQQAGDYAAWLAAQQRSAPAPVSESGQRGAEIFQEKSCASCHAILGTGAQANVGPDLTHLASRLRLGAGVMENTAANLSLWIQNPQVWKPASQMPNLKLTDNEVSDVVSYLETLQ